MTNCSEVCDFSFNAAKVVRKGGNDFCCPKCAADWDKKHNMPTLRTFLDGEKGFITFAETKHKDKPATLRYYKQGRDMLLRSELADLRLDELTDRHAQQFAKQFSALSPSSINWGLRTLRRALNLAYQWGKLDKPVPVALDSGENQRDRVLTEEESDAYLKACPQPWRDCATIILDEAFRPSEVFTLRWPRVFFNNGGTGLIQIVEGKSKAARRVLPMTPRVYQLLQARFEAAGRPSEGWVFPSASGCGHYNGDAAKDHHKTALKNSEVAAFVPYSLRHTALTRLGERAGGDVFTLARIAGRSSITITQRYIHPQAAAIERVFASLTRSKATTNSKPNRKRRTSRVGTQGSEVGTNLGTTENIVKTPLLTEGACESLKAAICDQVRGTPRPERLSAHPWPKLHTW